MIPPPGFETEKFPLRHRLAYHFGLSLGNEGGNTALLPIVMASKDTDVLPSTIQVNPHNSAFEEDTGPLCAQMSIIDRMSISLKFSMTTHCYPSHHASGLSGSEVFVGEDIPAFKFLWRPFFNSFPEKLLAADDDTTTTVEAILGLTSDTTNEDVVALTTNNLPAGGSNESDQPISIVNAVQVFGDYNMTTDLKMEDHVFSESLLQTALRRYTNKGALRSCIGNTRHVTLTRHKPFQNIFINKFLPRNVRRIVPYGYFGIQIHLPIASDTEQLFMTHDPTTVAHLGVSMIVNYHEWNIEHDQDRGTPG